MGLHLPEIAIVLPIPLVTAMLNEEGATLEGLLLKLVIVGTEIW